MTPAQHMHTRNLRRTAHTMRGWLHEAKDASRESWQSPHAATLGDAYIRQRRDAMNNARYLRGLIRDLEQNAPEA